MKRFATALLFCISLASIKAEDNVQQTNSNFNTATPEVVKTISQEEKVYQEYVDLDQKAKKGDRTAIKKFVLDVIMHAPLDRLGYECRTSGRSCTDFLTLMQALDIHLQIEAIKKSSQAQEAIAAESATNVQ